MPSADVLPLRVRRSLADLGRGLNVARRRRGLTAAMVAERAGVGLQTYRRVERGDPTVAMGTYVMALYVLGLDWRVLEHTVEPRADVMGTDLAVAALPKRVRPKRTPQPK